MPVTHDIDLGRRLVRSAAWGVVTAAEVLAEMEGTHRIFETVAEAERWLSEG